MKGLERAEAGDYLSPMTNRTVHGLLEYLADNGGSVVDLENGLSDFGPDLTDAAEGTGLIVVRHGNGMSVEDLYALTAKGWVAIGRERPPSLLARLKRVLVQRIRA